MGLFSLLALSFRKKNERITFAFMEIVKFNTDSTYQRIAASHIDEKFMLTEAEETIKTRLRHIHALRLNKKYSKHQAISIHIRDMNVSQATAYRDYSWAMQIYGELDKTDKQAEKMFLAENYWNLYQMALKNNDIEQARKCLDSYKSLFNFDKDEEVIDPNKIQAHEYHIHLSRMSSKVLRKVLADGVIDLNNVTAEDVDYEEINDVDSHE